MCPTSWAMVVAALSPLVDGMTYAGAPPNDSGCSPARARRSTAARHPARPTNSTRAGRSQLDHPGHPGRSRLVFGCGELAGPRGGPFDQVGHPDVVGRQRSQGPPGGGRADQAGRGGGGPEPVGRPGVAEARVGGHQARVEPAHQHRHARPDEVGNVRARVARTLSQVSRCSTSPTSNPAPATTRVRSSACHSAKKRPGNSSSATQPSRVPARIVISNGAPTARLRCSWAKAAGNSTRGRCR